MHPGAGFRSGRLNDHSLVVVASAGAHRLLLPGDIEKDAESVLLGLGPVAVLKVPHHGSRTSSTRPFVEAVDPTIAVVSAGRGNPFGHPHPDVVGRYLDLSIPLFRTDVDGTIQVHITGDKASVRAWRAGRGWRSLGAWTLDSPISGGGEEHHEGDQTRHDREPL